MSGNIPCFQSPRTNTLPESPWLVHKQILLSFTADKVNNTCSGPMTDHLLFTLRQRERLYLEQHAGEKVRFLLLHIKKDHTIYARHWYQIHHEYVCWDFSISCPFHPLWPYSEQKLHIHRASWHHHPILSHILCSLIEDNATFQLQMLSKYCC